MKWSLGIALLIAGFIKTPAFGWEKLCEFEGPGLSGKVSFLSYRIARQQRENGNWDYKIEIPASVGNRCGPGQYPEAHISAAFFMTKNVKFDSGDFKRYHGNHDLTELFEDKGYFECIAADFSTSYKCKF